MIIIILILIKFNLYILEFFNIIIGSVAQLVECSLCMRKAQGAKPCSSIFFRFLGKILIFFYQIYFYKLFKNFNFFILYS